MQPDERDLKLLWDMLKAARETVEFTSGRTFEQYIRDFMRRAALERVIQIIGEAASRVSPGGRNQLPNVEWGAIVATRHIIVHQYDQVDHEKLWRIATVHVPALIQEISPFLDAHPPGPEAQKDPAAP